jgi:hypothetical protein
MTRPRIVSEPLSNTFSESKIDEILARLYKAGEDFIEPNKSYVMILEELPEPEPNEQPNPWGIDRTDQVEQFKLVWAVLTPQERADIIASVSGGHS